MSRSLARCMLSLLISVPMLMAQGNTGSLSGTITDPNGAVVPGAKITARHEPTARELNTVSSEAGVYVFPNLEVGQYAVTVEQPGFKKLTRSGLVIAAATRAVLDLRLELGDVSQAVEVSAEAPLLSSATSEVGTTFQPKFMTDAPLFVNFGFRNPEAFVAFMPGVNNGSGDSSISGSTRRSKEILVDGASSINPESGGVAFNFASVDQFGEFKLLTGTFSSEYGRTGGGIEVFVTKSGGNNLHGNVFDHLRNDKLDAAGWSNNSRGLRKSKVRQNEYGFAVGGPVYLPKLYNGKNTSFFYVTYNGYKQNSGTTTGVGTLPTALMRQGDFTELGSKLIYDPKSTETVGGVQTRRPFDGNRIPQAQFSSVATKILPLIPAPSNPGISSNYATVNGVDLQRSMWSIKGDHAFSDRSRISGWINKQAFTTLTDGPLPGPLSNGNDNKDRPDNYRVSHDYSFRPNVLNHLSFGLTRYQNIFDRKESQRQNWPQTLGLKGPDESPNVVSFPVIRFGDGLTAFGRTSDTKTSGSQFNWNYHYQDTLSWTRGRHDLKFGYEYRYGRTFQNPTDSAGAQGAFTFQNFQTAAPGALRATTGYSFASFLLGGPDNAYRRFPAKAVDILYTYHAAFVNDNIKVSSKLTVNLGLRYDLFFPRYDRAFTQSTFDAEAVNPAAGGIKGALVFLGFGEGKLNKKRFGEVYKNNWGPRLGAAYQLDPKTVLRGGYGIYYSASNGNTGGGCFPCDYGQAAQPEVNSDGLNAAFLWDAGFPFPAGFRPPPILEPGYANGSSVLILTKEDGLPGRLQNWSFNIQRELPGRFLADVGYIGVSGTHLNTLTPYNQVHPSRLRLGALLGVQITDPRVAAAGFSRPYPSFTGTLAQALRPYPQYLNITHTYNGAGGSRYDALQAKVERRYSDYSLMLGYTFSKSLSRRGANTNTGNGVPPPDQYNLDIERSYLTYDIPHTLNIIHTWDLPFGRGKRFLGSAHPAISRIVSGWTVAAVQQYRSGGLLQPGLPNTLGPGVLFTQTLRARVTGQPILTNVKRTDLDPRNPNVRWLNRAAFEVPGQFTFGDAAAYFGELRNPPFLMENFSIIKRTPVAESVQIEYRVAMSNMFNRTLFGGINTNLTDPNYGLPTGVMIAPRLIQMSLVVSF